MLNRLCDGFWRHAERPFSEVIYDPALQYARLLRWLPLFYLWSLGLAWRQYHHGMTIEPPIDGLLWPLAWANPLHSEVLGFLFFGVASFGCAAATLKPRARWARITAIVGVFLLLALRYSYTGVQHRTYTLLGLAFFFALMPALPRREAADPDTQRRALLLAFGGAFFVLFTYSWAGAIKLWGAAEALAHGNDSLFDFETMPAVMHNRVMSIQNPPPLAAFLLDHPALARTGFFAAYYMEVVSLAALYRGHLQRWWFGILLAFHALTWATMGIFFVPATGMLLLLLFFSPFAREASRWREALEELPWLGPIIACLLAWLGRSEANRVETQLFYDERNAMASALATRTFAGPGDVPVAPMTDASYGALAARYPGWFERPHLVAISERAGVKRIRFDADAWLYALGGRGGATSLWAALLVIPIPLLQIGYRALDSLWPPFPKTAREADGHAPAATDRAGDEPAGR